MNKNHGAPDLCECVCGCANKKARSYAVFTPNFVLDLAPIFFFNFEGQVNIVKSIKLSRRIGIFRKYPEISLQNNLFNYVDMLMMTK